MCGHATINGTAFCRGLEKMDYLLHSDLEARISSITYLIDRAVLRLKYDKDSLGEASLVELIDMYRDREATIPSDKIFALLGMASDAQVKHSIRPDYELLPEALFEKVARYCLGSKVKVTHHTSSERPIIQGRGVLIGKIESVEKSNDRYDMQWVAIKFFQTLEASHYAACWGTRWTLRRTAIPINRGDLICFLEGAPLPSLIRADEDRFSVIMVSVQPHQSLEEGSKWHGYDLQGIDFTNDSLIFFISWDWSWRMPDSSSESDSDDGVSSPESLPAPERLYETARVLNRASTYHKASFMIKKLERHGLSTGKRNAYVWDSLDFGALSYQNAMVAGQVFERLYKEKTAALGLRHPSSFKTLAHMLETAARLNQLESWECSLMETMAADVEACLTISAKATASLVSLDHAAWLESILDMGNGAMAITSDFLQRFKTLGEQEVEIISHLLDRDGVSVEASAASTVLEVFEDHHLAVLLEVHGKKINPSPAAIEQAIHEGQHGKETFQHLLDKWENLTPLTDSFVLKALQNPSLGQEQVELILQRWKCDTPITDDLILAVLENSVRGPLVLQTLLSRKHVGEIQVTNHSVEEVIRSEVSGVEIFELLCKCYGKVACPGNLFGSDGIMAAAASDRMQGMTLMKYLLAFLAAETSLADDPPLTMKVLEAAVGNRGAGYSITKYLISHMGANLNLKTNILVLAAWNPTEGHRLMKLLIGQSSEPIKPLAARAVIEAAMRNADLGSTILNLALNPISDIAIIEGALSQAFKVGDVKIYKGLTAKLPNTLEMTGEFWVGLAENKGHQNEILRHILDSRDDNFTIPDPALLTFLHRCDDEVVGRLFDRLESGLTLTPEFIRDLNSDARFWTMDWLSYVRSDVNITHEALALLLEKAPSEDLMAYLERLPNDTAITERHIESAASRTKGQKKILRELVRRAPTALRTTNQAICNAIASRSWSGLVALFERWNRDACIPSWPLGKSGDLDVIDVMLPRIAEPRPSPTQWAEILARRGAKPLEDIFIRFGTDCQVTNHLVLTAARQSSADTLALIEGRRPQEMVMTDAIIENVGTGEVLAWILDVYGHTMPINGILLRRIAACVSKDNGPRKLLQRALAKCHLDLPLPEDVLVELAKRFKKRYVEFFLDKTGNNFHLTPRVVRASRFSSQLDPTQMPNQVLWTFVNRLRMKSRLEENAIAEIFHLYDEDFIRYICHRRGRTIKITEKIVNAVARNKHHQEILESLLSMVANNLLLAELPIVELMKQYLGNGNEKFTNQPEHPHSSTTEDAVLDGAVLDTKDRSCHEIQARGGRVVKLEMLNSMVTSEYLERVAADGEDHSRYLRRFLLSIRKSDGNVRVTSKALLQTARHHKIETLRLLLDYSTQDAPSLEALLVAAAQNRAYGDEMAILLLGRLPSDWTIVDSSVAQLVGSASPLFVALVLDHFGDCIQITTRALEGAAVNPHGTSALKLLWERAGDGALVTDKMVESAAGNQYGPEILEFLSQRGLQKARITELAMKNAAASPRAEQLLRFIASHWGADAPVTEDVMKAAVMNPRLSGLMALNVGWGDALPITDQVLEAAARRDPEEESTVEGEMRYKNNTIDNQNVVLFLLGLRGTRVPITEQTMQAIVRVRIYDLHRPRTKTSGCSPRILEQLIAFCEPLPATESVLMAATESGNGGKLVRMVLEQGKGKALTGEALLKAAVQSPKWNWRKTLALVMHHITVQDDDDDDDDEDNFSGAFSSLFRSSSVVSHDGTDDDASGAACLISGSVVEAAAGAIEGAEVLDFLCGHWGEYIQLTEGLVKSAAAGLDPVRSLRFISMRWGTDTPITEAVMKAAAGNKRPSDILQVIVDEWGKRLPITEDVVKAAAGNFEGEFALELLFDLFGDTVPVTDEVVEAAATNPHGRGILMFLIRRLRTGIRITDGVLRAAERNPKSKEMLSFINELLWEG